jgi:hypothetical protein
VAVPFEIEGVSYALTEEDAAALATALRRLPADKCEALGHPAAVAVQIEHELTARNGGPIRLSAEEGKAVLAAIAAGAIWTAPHTPLALARALQRRRRLELGLE